MTFRRAALFFLLISATLGCGNEPPDFTPLQDEQIGVNGELLIALNATDPDGDAVSFRFKGPAGSDRASIVPLEEGRALFRWTPLASDVGSHAFDFFASDGSDDTLQTITINVILDGESSAPAFVRPLGTGTVLDLEQSSCLSVEVMVDDPDSPDVLLRQRNEPSGAQLTQTGPFGGAWEFCPTADQIAGDDRYNVTFLAQDDTNEPVEKDFLVVLRNSSKDNCPGAPPGISHTPANQQTVNDVVVEATVTDDLGIKYEPLLYYSLTPPSIPPDLSQMTQLTMTSTGGGPANGTWTVSIPNPVAALPVGSTAQIYYLLEVEDNDDAEGSCDHLTTAPSEGTFVLTVENPGGGGGLELCAECTADSQCGGEGDHCLYMGGSPHCFRGCDDTTDCGAGYYCSFTDWTSVDDAVARQCIPDTFTCETASNECADDSREENDTLAEASQAPPLADGQYALTSCADDSEDDEDWFAVTVAQNTMLDLTLAGGTVSDLDLQLRNSTGSVIATSGSLTSNESISTCLTDAGTYYVRVYSWGDKKNDYVLTVARSGCPGPSCTDDAAEDDDDRNSARSTTFAGDVFNSPGNAICSLDDDYFSVSMFAGETLYAKLTFTQANSSEDLDLWIDDGTAVVVGCNEQNPGACDSNNGQSGTADENASFAIPTTGTYYVVVHGWNGAENDYSLCLSYTPTGCL